MELSDLSVAIINHIKTLIKDDDIYGGIYETAVDYYGEKNVSFQLNTDVQAWCRFLHEYSFCRLCEFFHIKEDKLPFANCGDEIQDVLRTQSRLDLFLDFISRSSIEKSKIPLFSTIIHFRDFEVVNEHDRSTSIEDLYVQVYTDYKKRICHALEWGRTTFSFIHYNAGYCHSHMPSGVSSSRIQWRRPCLGSGPITMTILSLRKEYEEDIWRLFWHELNLCVHTESLAGGPYFKIEDIRNRIDAFHTYDTYNKVASKLPNYKEIIVSIIDSGKLKLVYDVDHIIIGNSYADFHLIASNAYLDVLYQSCKTNEDRIKKLNREFERDMFFVGNIDAQGRVLRYYGQGRLEYSEGRIVETDFRFKGITVPLVILPRNDRELPRPEYVLLSSEYVTFLYLKIIFLANYLYGNYN